MKKVRQGRIDKMRSSMMRKRVILYSIVIFLLAVARGSFFARLEILPASPDLVLGVVAAVAVVDSIETAAITGVIGGVITDAVGGFGMYLSPIVYLVAAIVIAMATKKMMPRYLSWLATFPIACLIGGGATLLKCFLFGSPAAFVQLIRHIIIPEFIITVIFALPLFPLIKLCSSVGGGRSGIPLK